MDILILLPLLVSVFILFKLRANRSTRKPRPPGPLKLPFIGNLHNLAGALPHRRMKELAQKYGDVMELRMGEVPLVVVTSADAAKDVLKTNDINFATRPVIPQAEIIGYGACNLTYSPYGEYWRQLRKIVTLELLSVKRVQSFGAMRLKIYTDLMKWVASMEGSPVNVTDRLYTTTYSFTTTVALGKMTEQRGKLLPLILESFETATKFDICQHYPSVTLFRMMSGFRKKLAEVHGRVDVVLEGILQQRLQERKTNVKTEEQEDLLDVLLKYTSDTTDIRLSNDNIKSVVLDVLGAGTETSATTMDWALTELMRNPRVMKKAQEELRRVMDEQGYVDSRRMNELKYMKLVVKEVLRLHPPVPMLLPRKNAEACEIKGYEIPAGTKVYINAWAINRDPGFWENPESFYPERFADGTIDFAGPTLDYMPFGAGRRMCPGMSFGLANVEFAISMFLYHFDWKLGGGLKPEDVDISESPGITIKRKNDLILIADLKRPLPVFD